jgi:hypothetical protein
MFLFPANYIARHLYQKVIHFHIRKLPKNIKKARDMKKSFMLERGIIKRFEIAAKKKM